MARVYQDGFEFNSVTANPATYETISGSPTISSTTFRSGAYAGRVSSLSSGAAKGWTKKWLASTAGGPYWGRVYLNVATRPSASNHIISFNSATGTAGNSERIKITLESDGTLILRQADGTQIGSASAALTLNTWYMVELKFDRTPAGGSQTGEARLDGSVFATTSTLTYAGGVFTFSVGGNFDLEAQTTGDWFFDDVAINDSTGSFQNSYPGQGKIIHLRPSAAGDANAFSTQTGGTAGAANNFTRVNEVTPDDATTFNGDALLNDEDLYNVDNSGIGASDTVNVVMVGGRFRNNTADATTQIQFEVEKAAAGTKSSSAAIVPNTTSWNSLGIASPRVYPIVLYQDPDSSAWTQTTLDSMQIGMKMGLIGINRIDVTNIWVSVDYTPVANTTVTPSTASLTTSTFAPTVTASDHKIAVPSVLPLTLSTFVPAIIVGTVATPATAGLVITPFAPTVPISNNQSATPTTLALSSSTFAPGVLIDSKVTPATAATTLATFEPTITITTNVLIRPGVANLMLTSFPPLVNHSVVARRYFIDSDANIYWVVNQAIGLVEKI